MDIHTVIEELLLFSDKLLELNTPADLQAVSDFEKRIDFKLPGDYIELIKRYNGISLMGVIVYGVGIQSGALSIDKNFVFEHEEVGNPMFDYLVPFSPDGFGNHYCFDVRTIDTTSCRVVFWQHDYHYSHDEDPPEVTNNSFAEWLKEVVIDWTLEDHDYNGNAK